MKAVQIQDYGHADKLEVRTVDVPEPGDGDVQVKVAASSLNPVDSMIREGYLRQMVDMSMPFTLGSDIAGEVSAVGDGVTSLAPGDKVYGVSQAIAGGSGALAEYAVTPADRLARMPENLTYDEAASFPLVGVSAWQALEDHIGLRGGQKIFIHGGSGGIGSIAIQIAKHGNAYIVASAKAGKEAYVKSLGADEVIDGDSENFCANLHDFDALLNLVREPDWGSLLSILKEGGTVVSLTGQPDETVVAARNLQAFTQRTDVNTARLEALAKLIEEGVVTPQVEKTFSLHDIKKAVETQEAGGISGKIVISIAEEKS